MFERFASTFGHAIWRVFRETRAYSRASENEFRKIAHEGRAARHDDAVVYDVGREFWRSFLQDIFDGTHHGAKFLADGAHDFIRAYFQRARKPRQMVAPFHLH